MDIERMQKINNLARELVQRGMAEDMMEATKQAESIINKNDPSISNVMRVDSRNMNASSMSSTRKEERQMQPQMNAEQEEEIRLQLRKLTNQLNEQSKLISDLKLNIINVINEINRMKIEPRKPAVIERPKLAGSDHDQTVLSKDATEVKPHARTGNYNTEDVSIEKFFYAGPPR